MGSNSSLDAQPQGPTATMWPKAVCDYDASGNALFAILSQSSSDNPPAKSCMNLPPWLTCVLRRPSSSQWESSRPAISQRFSRRMRSRVVSPLFPNATCFLHVAVSPSSSTWPPQVAPHPIISPDELAISAGFHPPVPQGIPLRFFILASPGLRPSDEPDLSDSAIGMSRDRLSDPDELSSSADL